jgi:hypothetical protein
MPSHAVELAHISLSIARLMDAELLLDEHGAVLLAETDAAQRFFEAGETEAARHHIARLAQRAEALVETRALALADGRAVLIATNRILNPEKDAGDEAG